MTTSQINSTVYVIENGSINSMTYGEYLINNGRDDTTSPNGVAARMHIREISGAQYKHIATDKMISQEDYNNLSEEQQERYAWYGELVNSYEIWSWGTGGNHPYYTGTSFETREEAELEIYSYFENYIENANCNIPSCFSSYEEAVQDLANLLDRSYEVVLRYQKLLEVTAIREAKEQAEREIIRNARKNEIQISIDADIARLKPLVDQQFKDEVLAAMTLSGNEKSKACSSAFTSFLNRVSSFPITSDFWKVFKGIK